MRPCGERGFRVEISAGKGSEAAWRVSPIVSGPSESGQQLGETHPSSMLVPGALHTRPLTESDLFRSPRTGQKLSILGDYVSTRRGMSAGIVIVLPAVHDPEPAWSHEKSIVEGKGQI